MLLGYARVSTDEQNPAHQLDALTRAGVNADDVYLDRASGAKANRPQLDLLLRHLRAGDTLVITRLDRLGRSVLHLVTLGAALRERGVQLRVLEPGIDTATAEGRAMSGMLSVLAELQRELIVANTRDGLAAARARARGRTGGRRPKLSPSQARHAQELYDEPAPDRDASGLNPGRQRRVGDPQIARDQGDRGALGHPVELDSVPTELLGVRLPRHEVIFSPSPSRSRD